jgi:hypothetical protein
MTELHRVRNRVQKLFFLGAVAVYGDHVVIVSVVSHRNAWPVANFRIDDQWY